MGEWGAERMAALFPEWERRSVRRFVAHYAVFEPQLHHPKHRMHHPPNLDTAPDNGDSRAGHNTPQEASDRPFELQPLTPVPSSEVSQHGNEDTRSGSVSGCRDVEVASA